MESDARDVKKCGGGVGDQKDEKGRNHQMQNVSGGSSSKNIV
jgi:hypothetical protein